MTTPKVRLRKWRYEPTFTTYMIVRAFVCSLYPAFILYFTFQKSASLSDAKVTKYIFQDFIRRDFATNYIRNTFKCFT